jgi:hypothetical protein
MVMKKIITIIVLMAMTFSIPAGAGTAACATIRDHDSRMMCMAGATGMSSYCSFIKDPDTRTRCHISLGK